MYYQPPTSRLPQYNNQLHLTTCSSITIEEEDNDSYISKNDYKNSNIIHKNTTKVSITTSLTERTGFQIHKPTRSQPKRIIAMDKRKFENNYKQNTNLKNKSKTKDDRFYSLQLVTPSRIQTSIHQTKLTSIIQDNDKISFGNNINNKDKFSTRIIFSNTNGLNFDTDSHSLHELLISSQKYNTYILLLVETDTHWKNKRAYDNFRKTIAQH